MTEEVFGQFLSGGMVLCLVMALFSTLLRWRKFGPSSLALGFAFLAMAVLLYGLSVGWRQSAIISVAVVLVLLLAGDAFLRSNVDIRQ